MLKEFGGKNHRETLNKKKKKNKKSVESERIRFKLTGAEGQKGQWGYLPPLYI